MNVSKSSLTWCLSVVQYAVRRALVHLNVAPFTTLMTGAPRPGRYDLVIVSVQDQGGQC
jgi:hypothetical protein